MSFRLVLENVLREEGVDGKVVQRVCAKLFDVTKCETMPPKKSQPILSVHHKRQSDITLIEGYTNSTAVLMGPFNKSPYTNFKDTVLKKNIGYKYNPRLSVGPGWIVFTHTVSLEELKKQLKLHKIEYKTKTFEGGRNTDQDKPKETHSPRKRFLQPNEKGKEEISDDVVISSSEEEESTNKSMISPGIYEDPPLLSSDSSEQPNAFQKPEHISSAESSSNEIELSSEESAEESVNISDSSE